MLTRANGCEEGGLLPREASKDKVAERGKHYSGFFMAAVSPCPPSHVRVVDCAPTETLEEIATCDISLLGRRE